MKLYWAMAEYEAKEKDVFGNKIWTYDGSTSREKAEEVFSAWKANGYNLTKAWIDVTEGTEKIERIEINLQKLENNA